MSLNEEQVETVNEISPRGLHLNDGEPCECGGENYFTSTEHGYSDFVTYHHECEDCGNKFSTYTEG